LNKPKHDGLPIEQSIWTTDVVKNDIEY
jgi:nucleoside-diphosphate kinase